MDKRACVAIAQREGAKYMAQLKRDAAQFYYFGGDGMTSVSTPDPSTYTTEELRRLTTLTEAKASGASTSATPIAILVLSFTDPTERDPGQGEMLGELARRELAATFTVGERVTDLYGSPFDVVAVTERSLSVRAPGGTSVYDNYAPSEFKKLPAHRFKQGDVVVQASTFHINTDHLATVRADVRADARDMAVTWDDRVPRGSGGWDNGTCWNPECFRLATPADRAAFEARIPKPKLAVGDLAFDTTCAFVTVKVIEVASDGDYRAEGKYGVGRFSPHWLRPATDPEIAAYHRLHCQKAAPISNATHAGRRVRLKGYPGERVIMTTGAAEVVAARYTPGSPFKFVWNVALNTGAVHNDPAALLELLP